MSPYKLLGPKSPPEAPLTSSLKEGCEWMSNTQLDSEKPSPFPKVEDTALGLCEVPRT